MSLLNYLIIALAKVAGFAINLYTMIVIVAALISWVSPDPFNPIVKILRGLTEPVFRFARRLMPEFLLRTRIDFSPIVVLLTLVVLDALVSFGAQWILSFKR